MKISRNYNTYKNYNSVKRGKIAGYSANSRRRFMDKLSRIDRNKTPLFGTLTFADEHISTKCRHVALVKAFEMRLHRAYPGVGGFWRKEFAARKSGKYIGELFPHYHFILWGVHENLESFRAWVAINWYEVCGSVEPSHLAAGTSVDRIRDWRGVMSYASKYMSKVDLNSYGSTGRLWGTWRVENIPFVKAILLQLKEEEAVTLIRYMRRFAKLHSRDYKSLSVMCNVDFWYGNLAKILYGNA